MRAAEAAARIGSVHLFEMGAALLHRRKGLAGQRLCSLATSIETPRLAFLCKLLNCGQKYCVIYAEDVNSLSKDELRWNCIDPSDNELESGEKLATIIDGLASDLIQEASNIYS